MAQRSRGREQLATQVSLDRTGVSTPLPTRRRRLAAVSLFSGCGGLDLGAEHTGKVSVVWANDMDDWAVKTYRRNLGNHIAQGDIRDIPVPQVPCDILLAGPPCQDFSTLWNHDGAMTARGNLFREVARFLDAMQPAAFVMENVPGLLSANHGAAWTVVRHALKAPSTFMGTGKGVRYEISVPVHDMADFGVPQHRERLLIMGIRRDLGVRPPEVTKAYEHHPVTVAETLDARPIAEDAPNHERGLDSEDVVDRLRLIPPGENFTAIPNGHPLAVRGLISHVYRRLHPSEPSYTVIANGGGGTHGYHHLEPRRLSNRERARLQSFPDDFVFEDRDLSKPRDTKSAYPRARRQIGNAVPPLAARTVVSALADTLATAGIMGLTGVELRQARSVAMAGTYGGTPALFDYSGIA